ncbi:MAG: NAD(P)-dependent oxidoreductase [Sulfuricellaceae bacterium]
MKFTLLGASGFIGSHLLAHLEASGHECFAPARDDATLFEQELGQVIYCIGLTADFRRRPFDTARAHVCFLAEVLEKADFASLLYLSSTRVYAGSSSGDEDARLLAGDLYNLSKLTGEALCCAGGRDNVRVARLSNVFGNDFSSDNFLPAIIRTAVREGRVTLDTALDAAKDYVSIRDVVNILPRIATQGKFGIYNVAGGRNTGNRELLAKLSEITGCSVDAPDGAPATAFPPISIGRLEREFTYAPLAVLDCLEGLIAEYRQAFENKGK